MTWPMGLARRPARTRSRYSASVATMPPPEPPSVKAGRMTAGRPISSSAARVRSWRSAGVAPSTMTDGGYGWPIRSSSARNAWRSSAISMASSGVPRSRVLGCALEDARRARAATHRFSAVWPPRPDRMPSGFSRSRIRSTDCDGQRLEVDDVGHAGVGHDRGRVAVEQDRAHALVAQRAAGLGAGVVELGRLADDHRARADDQHRRWAWRALGRSRGTLAWHGRAPRSGRRPRPRPAVRASPPGGTGRSRSASSSCRRPSTEPSFRLRWLTVKPLLGGQGLADHLDLVVLRRHLDAAGVKVLHRVVRAVVAEAQAARVRARRAATIWWPRQIPRSGRPSSIAACARRTGPHRAAPGRPGRARGRRPRTSGASAALGRGGVRQDPDPCARAPRAGARCCP